MKNSCWYIIYTVFNQCSYSMNFFARGIVLCHVAILIYSFAAHMLCNFIITGFVLLNAVQYTWIYLLVMLKYRKFPWDWYSMYRYQYQYFRCLPFYIFLKDYFVRSILDLAKNYKVVRTRNIIFLLGGKKIQVEN